MKRRMIFLFYIISAVIFTTENAVAVNITIYDGRGVGTGWYGAQEDQEVEPNCVANQAWDLEGFFLTGSKLTTVGGYNFVSYGGFDSGDIFINSAVGGATGTYGYEYALKLDIASSRYFVYSLDADSILNTVFYGQNNYSNPCSYVAENDDLIGVYSLTYSAGLDDFEDSGLLGGNHYAIALDLSDFLASGTEFFAHYTMVCGNDNIMGHGMTAPVPEPATMLVFGAGLIGIAGIARKKKNNFM